MDSDRTPRRKDVKTLEQQLPYPYNQDLSKILRGLNRRTSFARRRLANDPVTAAYLAAAVRLIQRHLGPGASRTSADPDDDDSIERPVLSFLSQRAVVRGIHHLSSLVMTRLLNSPMFRLGLIAAAEAEGDSVIRDAISERHGEAGPLWR
jgi:hypothetical protein